MKYGKFEIDFSEWPSANLITIQVNGRTYRREGYCCRCGDCCDKTKGVPEYFRNEDGSCRQLHFETDGNGERKSFCGVYWNRPMGCMMYPIDPNDPLPERCTYKFVEVTDG